MTAPVGWIVLSRENNLSHEISIVGILDAEVLPDREQALDFLREKMPACKALRLSVFGIMDKNREHVSKRNLSTALRELDLPTCNVDEIFRNIAGYILKVAEYHRKSC